MTIITLTVQSRKNGCAALYDISDRAYRCARCGTPGVRGIYCDDCRDPIPRNVAAALAQPDTIGDQPDEMIRESFARDALEDAAASAPVAWDWDRPECSFDELGRPITARHPHRSLLDRYPAPCALPAAIIDRATQAQLDALYRAWRIRSRVARQSQQRRGVSATTSREMDSGSGLPLCPGCGTEYLAVGRRSACSDRCRRRAQRHELDARAEMRP